MKKEPKSPLVSGQLYSSVDGLGRERTPSDEVLADPASVRQLQTHYVAVAGPNEHWSLAAWELR